MTHFPLLEHPASRQPFFVLHLDREFDATKTPWMSDVLPRTLHCFLWNGWHSRIWCICELAKELTLMTLIRLPDLFLFTSMLPLLHTPIVYSKEHQKLPVSMALSALVIPHPSVLDFSSLHQSRHSHPKGLKIPPSWPPGLFAHPSFQNLHANTPRYFWSP